VVLTPSIPSHPPEDPPPPVKSEEKLSTSEETPLPETVRKLEKLTSLAETTSSEEVKPALVTPQEEVPVASPVKEVEVEKQTAQVKKSVALSDRKNIRRDSETNFWSINIR